MAERQDEIVVTGVGTISPFGVGADLFWQGLEEGRTVRHSLKDMGEERSTGALIRDWQPADLLGKRGLQYLGASSQYVSAAALLALQDAGLEFGQVNPDEIGAVVSTNLAGMQSIMQYDATTILEGPQYVSPMEAPNTLANAPASHLAIRVKARALNTTISTGQCSGLDALGYACRVLQEGRAHYLLVCGVEEINPTVLWQYRSMGVLATEGAEKAGLPFDPESTGWLPGEGASVLVLERRAQAEERGRSPLASIAGWSSSFVSPRTVSKRAEGLLRTVRSVLAGAQVSPESVGLVMSGASGLRPQDEAEALMLGELFADAGKPAPVCAIKGAIGEGYGASGAFQAAAAVGALLRGVVPPTVGSHGQALGLSDQMRSLELAKPYALLTAQDLFGLSSAVLLQAEGRGGGAQ